MTNEQFFSLQSTDNVCFDVDYSTINDSKILINNIVFLSEFNYKYDKDGNFLNFPILSKNQCWNSKEMYIYNK